MAKSSIKKIVKESTQTVTFDSNGYAETTIPTTAVLISARSTLDWESFTVFANDYSSYWRIKVVGSIAQGDTRTVVLYYID